MSDRVLLYVEDDESAHYLLASIIKEAGMNVKVERVSNGQAAIAFLHRGEPYQCAPRPDLIVLDLNLPGRNGLTVLAEIRQNPRFRAIPIVIFTSSTEASDRAQSLALGATEYITKPSTYDAFVNAVMSACSFFSVR